MAADVELVAAPSQPISVESPVVSSAVTPLTPRRDQDSCAPTRAQAIPSSTRCLARSRTEEGTSSRVVLAIQVASRPVGPAGSVAGRADFPGSLAVLGASEIAMAFHLSPWISDLRFEIRLAKWATSTATSSSSPLLTEAMKDSGLSAFHTAIPNTDSRGTTEFSDAEADITQAARPSSGRYTGEEVRRVIASLLWRPPTTASARRKSSVPRHQPYGGSLADRT